MRGVGLAAVWAHSFALKFYPLDGADRWAHAKWVNVGSFTLFERTVLPFSLFYSVRVRGHFLISCYGYGQQKQIREFLQHTGVMFFIIIPGRILGFWGFGVPQDFKLAASASFNSTTSPAS